MRLKLIPRRWAILWFLFSCSHLWGLAAPALNSAPTADVQAQRISKLEQQTADARSSADNSWMLTSSALVLMMTGPGLALFYGGLVRKKNVLSTMLQSFAMMAVISVLWALVGYSLAFGSGNSFIGGFHNSFLRGVGRPPPPPNKTTQTPQKKKNYKFIF